MIDVQLLRKEPDKVKQGIAAKQADPALVDKFLALDEEWRTASISLPAVWALCPVLFLAMRFIIGFAN